MTLPNPPAPAGLGLLVLALGGAFFLASLCLASWLADPARSQETRVRAPALVNLASLGVVLGALLVLAGAALLMGWRWP